ncbi:MAG: dihydroorotate dehydrogenase-like protein [Gaiellales bacterium]
MAANLGTTYLGLELGCPLVASASPLTGELLTLRQLADAGAGAVVLPSLFEEELVVAGDEHAADVLWEATDVAGSAAAYLGRIDRTRLERHLDLVRDAVTELDIPVIASLNGSTPGGWTKTAELLQLAGAHAIELNVYGIETDRYASAGSVEDRVLRLVYAVKNVVSIPISVKLSPYYTAFANLAHRLGDVPVDGLVLFNRFFQPQIDLATMDVKSELTLSHRDELRLPLRWIAILRDRLPISLAATSGIHTGEDAARAILAGADVAMMASALIAEGVGRLADAKTSLEKFLDEHGFPSVVAARGRLSQSAAGDPRAYERAQYVRAMRANE